MSKRSPAGNMDDDALAIWAVKIGLSKDAIHHVLRIRKSPPCRMVQGAFGVSGRYISKKMGTTIDFESRGGELAVYTWLDWHPEYLEYYAQPCPLTVEYDQDGRSESNLFSLG